MDQQQQQHTASLPAVSPPLLSPKAIALRKAQQRVPTTHGGIPVGFYRIDLLPGNTSGIRDPNPNDLEAAYVELGFQEGFPTLPGGAPFWFKLDYEPGIAYSAFQLYLEQADTGPRSLIHIAEDPGLKQSLNGHTLQMVNEWHTIYCWQARAKSYDIYHEAAYRHIRAKRALYTEDKHFQVAESLLEIATKYIASKDFLEQMSPKTALEALKLAASLQRVSVGLPAAGPLSAKDEQATPSTSNFELIIKKTGQKSSPDTFDASGNLISDASLHLDKVLDDPQNAAVMQEVIIRMSATSKGRDFDRDQRHRPRSDDFEDVVPNDAKGEKEPAASELQHITVRPSNQSQAQDEDDE